ncbi:MAG: bifunctional phosphoribosyl-AMP cyclohydrolase/phosphoribosyl-ATP diphosphatase HisIE [Polyangiales bacterium]
MQLEALKWDRDGLVTVVVQDAFTGEVRMVAHANHAAVQSTFDTGFAHFYSRSRQQLWCKGESSGNRLQVNSVWADCDGDALIYLAVPEGPSCHTLRETCFFSRATAGVFTEDPKQHAQSVLPQLWQELTERRDSTAQKSYTRSLLDAGVAKIGAKVEEEAGELVQALHGESDERVVSEAADVLYHVLVGLLARGVSMRDVEAELARRSGMSGLVEKASRAPKPS